MNDQDKENQFSLNNDGENLKFDDKGKVNDERMEQIFEDIRNKPECAVVLVVNVNENGKHKSVMMGSVAKVAALLSSTAMLDEKFKKSLMIAAQAVFMRS